GTITILPLETTDKMLAGAINEINAKADGNKENLTTHLADFTSHLDESNEVAHQIKNISGLQTVLDNKIESSGKGQPNGVATLGADGKISDNQKPVDVVDVGDEITIYYRNGPTITTSSSYTKMIDLYVNLKGALR